MTKNESKENQIGQSYEFTKIPLEILCAARDSTEHSEIVPYLDSQTEA